MRYMIRERSFELGEDSDITDDDGQPVYSVDAKAWTLNNKAIIRDRAGMEVASVERQMIALQPIYHIRRAGVEVAEVRKKLFSPFVAHFTIDIPGPEDLEVTGSLWKHDYTFTRAGQEVATVSKHWVSLGDTYGVEIAPGEDDALILASMVAIDLAGDRERLAHRLSR